MDNVQQNWLNEVIVCLHKFSNKWTSHLETKQTETMIKTQTPSYHLQAHNTYILTHFSISNEYYPTISSMMRYSSKKQELNIVAKSFHFKWLLVGELINFIQRRHMNSTSLSLRTNPCILQKLGAVWWHSFVSLAFLTTKSTTTH
jgi:hypothetical protein